MYCGCAVIVDINSNRKVGLFQKTEVLEKPQVKIWVLLMRFGAMTGCHQLQERSFFLNNYQFPVCARCTGLFLGQIAGIVSFFIFTKYDIKLLFLLAIISVMLLGIDGFGQLKKIWISTNLRRLITGVLCGYFVTVFNINIIVMVIGVLTKYR